MILEENSEILPADKEPFIGFLRTYRELYSVSVRTLFTPEDATSPQEFTLRKKNPSTPLSTLKASKTGWNFPSSIISKYPLPQIDEWK